jgi:ABC-type Zn uptake system ZnuABC Zn-binding protein ZnuA
MWSRVLGLMLGLIICSPHLRAKPLAIVASTTDLAAVAVEIGGSSVVVEALCAAGQDPHDAELLPAHWVAVKSAVIYLKVGAGLDPWADKLIQTAGRPELRVVDCSDGITLLTAETNHGDHVHAKGNPHYGLGPSSYRQIAFTICAALCGVNSYGRPSYEANRDRFIAALDSSIITWAARLAPCGSPAVLTYHSTWDYFARDFGWTIAGTIEPHPGIEPGPADLARLMEIIRSQGVKLCLTEPYYTGAMTDLFERDAGLTVVKLPSAVSDHFVSGSIFSFFEEIVSTLLLSCAGSR